MSVIGGDTPQLPLLVDGAPPLSQQPLDTPERVRRETIRQIVRSPTFAVGAVVTLFWVTCAIFGTHIAPYDPINDSFAPSYAPPSWAHPFGIDRVGRDVFSRVLVGARSVMLVAPGATIVGVSLGTVIGLIMGYFGGWTDNVIGRVIDAVLAVPFIVAAILVLALIAFVPEAVLWLPRLAGYKG